MLDHSTRKTLEASLRCIMLTPKELSQDIFVSTHNSVYSFCTLPSSDTFCIAGEPIFRLIEEKADLYTKSLRFTPSVPAVAELLVQFNRTADLLNKVFSYLARFYIRTALLNRTEIVTDTHVVPVEPLDRMFLKKIYFNFLYRAEEDLQSLVLAELETYRSKFRQNCSDLSSLVEAYTHILLFAGQEESLKRFHKRYVLEFMDSTDFVSSDIGKLLKKIYLEMFYATHIFRDKNICREIASRLALRAREVTQHAFQRIRADESFRHIYKIINMMDESTREEFRCGYLEVMDRLLCASNGFDSLYETYKKLRSQIESNRMAGWLETLDRRLKARISQLGVSSDIAGECVAALDAALKRRPLEIDQNVLDFASLLDCDLFIEKYTDSCQARLLSGLSPDSELLVLKGLEERLGSGPLSRLQSSVCTYLRPFVTLSSVSLSFCPSGHGTVNLLKHMACFWSLKPQKSALVAELERIATQARSMAVLKYRERIQFNFRMSPIVVKINGTRFRMNTDMFSLYYHIHSQTIKQDTAAILESFREDAYSQPNLLQLKQAGLVAEEDGGLRTVAPAISTGAGCVDLFRACDETSVPERSSGAELKSAVLSAALCRELKKEKSISVEELRRRFEAEKEHVERAINDLVERGYLEYDGDTVTYVP